MRNIILPLCCFTIAVELTVPAVAVSAHAANAVTARGVEMQAGPAPEYPDVMRLAPRLHVTIHGCARSWNWCDVEWRGNRGWVPAEALSYSGSGTSPPGAGARASIPEIRFDLDSYWEAHYRQRPWYPDRREWSTHLASAAFPTEAR